MALLDIQNLNLTIGDAEILKDISLSVEAGKIVAIVGESGSGKSMTSSAVMNLLPGGSELSGRIWLSGEDLLEKTEEEMCAVRADSLGMVFQEPMTALNPVETIGAQVMEAIKLSEPSLSKADLKEKAAEILHRVGLENNRFPLDTYPHKLSGGQRQRVVIAIAISQKPSLLIADEPTTALDVTTQAKILDLLKKLVERDSMGMLLISHDLAVVGDVADHIIIMKDGEIVERGDVPAIFDALEHDYSKALFDAAAGGEASSRFIADSAGHILTVKNLIKEYKLTGGKTLKAVNDVSFKIKRGENVGLVGESGCGKSTLSRCILGLEDITKGEILINGQPFTGERELRSHINVVFQDPYGSFNPRHSVGRIVAEPFFLMQDKVNEWEKEGKVKSLLKQVGLNESDAAKYPHEFSGGQRQRIAIARALITEPDLILLDEATSALDVLIRGEILELLERLSDQLGISYLFISHDLATVQHITDRVMVMKDGVIVEEGITANIYARPQHPYTKALLEASPDITKVIKNRQEISHDST